MKLGEAMAMELQQEAKATRKALERLKDERLDWKPHQKSWTTRQLASHVVNLLGWTIPTVQQSEMVIEEDYRPWEAGSVKDLVDRFDANVAEAVKELAACPDEKMMEDWSLKSKDAVYFSMPRAAVLRTFVLNHLVHHRGQLSVYLRLQDIPVPAIYGPSADEQN